MVFTVQRRPWKPRTFLDYENIQSCGIYFSPLRITRATRSSYIHFSVPIQATSHCGWSWARFNEMSVVVAMCMTCIYTSLYRYRQKYSRRLYYAVNLQYACQKDVWLGESRGMLSQNFFQSTIKLLYAFTCILRLFQLLAVMNFNMIMAQSTATKSSAPATLVQIGKDVDNFLQIYIWPCQV